MANSARRFRQAAALGLLTALLAIGLSGATAGGAQAGPTR
jgi:acyl dehydratase